MNEESYAAEQEKRACEELITALRKTLRNALMNDVDWYKVLGITIYQTADFCRETRAAETAELTAISLYALCLSVFEDIDQEKLKSFSEQFSIEVEAPPKIAGNEDKAAAIILGACEEIFSDLVGLKFSQKVTRH